MPSTSTSMLDGLSTSVAVKAPCVAATVVPITLSGLQDIGGVTVAEGDRVLVISQADLSENGIYNASTGSWTRALDFDGNRDVVQGTLVLVRSDVVDGAIYEVTSDNPIVIGDSDIEFTLHDAPGDAEVASTAHVQSRQNRGAFTLPATVKFFGDSFWAEPNSHTSSTHSMAYKAAALLGVTASIDATSGNTSADKQDAIFAANPASTACWMSNLGQNDAQFVGTGSDIEMRLNDIALVQLANLFQMAVPSGSRRYLASSFTAAGTWAADAEIPEGGAVKSNTNADTLQVQVADSRYIVVIFKVKNSSGGKFSVIIDGTTHAGSIDSTGYHSAPLANIPTNTAKTFMRCALVFDTGRRKPLTTVQIQVSSATNASNVVSICSVMGLSGAPLTGPQAVACDLTDRAAAGYATAAGSQASVQIVNRLICQAVGVVAATGARILLVPIGAAISPTTDLDTDEFHPKEAGANNGAAAIATTVTNAAIDFSTTWPGFDAQALLNGADGYVLLAGAPLHMGADYLWKRRKFSPKHINSRASDPFLSPDSYRFCYDDGSGATVDASVALYIGPPTSAGDDTTVGASGASSPLAFMAYGATRARITTTGIVGNATHALVPQTTDLLQLGAAAKLFSDVFATKITTPAVAFASLPAAASNTDRTMICTDSNTAVFNATAAGGGANRVRVHSDGANWKVG